VSQWVICAAFMQPSAISNGNLDPDATARAFVKSELDSEARLTATTALLP